MTPLLLSLWASTAAATDALDERMLVHAHASVSPLTDLPRSEVCDPFRGVFRQDRIARLLDALEAHPARADAGEQDWITHWVRAVQVPRGSRAYLRAWLRDAPSGRRCGALCDELRSLTELFLAEDSLTGDTSNAAAVTIAERAARNWPESTFMPWYAARLLGKPGGQEPSPRLATWLARASDAERVTLASWAVCQAPGADVGLEHLRWSDLDDLRERFPLADVPLVLAAAERGDASMLQRWRELHASTLLDRVAASGQCAAAERERGREPPEPYAVYDDDGQLVYADTPKGFVVAPSGLLFKCWNQVHMTASAAVGHVAGHELPRASHNASIWDSYDPLAKSGCRDCRVLASCMGSCPWESLRNQLEVGTCQEVKFFPDEVIRMAHFELSSPAD